MAIPLGLAIGVSVIAVFFVGRAVMGHTPEVDNRLSLNQQATERAYALRGGDATAYGYNSTCAPVNFPIKIIDKLINANYPEDLIIAKLGDETMREEFNDASPHSLALVLRNTNEMIGLYLYEKEGMLYFMDLWEYKDVFCTYLNLGCNVTSFGTNYLDNRIPWFDRFIFFSPTNE